VKVSFALAERVWWLEEVTGGGRTRWRGAACLVLALAQAETGGLAEGLDDATVYRELRQRASGDGARIVRLTGFLAEVSRQAVWYGSRQSAECLGGRVCSRWAEGQGWRSVGLS